MPSPSDEPLRGASRQQEWVEASKGQKATSTSSLADVPARKEQLPELFKKARSVSFHSCKTKIIYKRHARQFLHNAIEIYLKKGDQQIWGVFLLRRRREDILPQVGGSSLSTGAVEAGRQIAGLEEPGEEATISSSGASTPAPNGRPQEGVSVRRGDFLFDVAPADRGWSGGGGREGATSLSCLQAHASRRGNDCWAGDQWEGIRRACTGSTQPSPRPTAPPGKAEIGIHSHTDSPCCP